MKAIASSTRPTSTAAIDTTRSEARGERGEGKEQGGGKGKDPTRESPASRRRSSSRGRRGGAAGGADGGGGDKSSAEKNNIAGTGSRTGSRGTGTRHRGVASPSASSRVGERRLAVEGGGGGDDDGVGGSSSSADDEEFLEDDNDDEGAAEADKTVTDVNVDADSGVSARRGNVVIAGGEQQQQHQQRPAGFSTAVTGRGGTGDRSSLSPITPAGAGGEVLSWEPGGRGLLGRDSARRARGGMPSGRGSAGRVPGCSPYLPGGSSAVRRSEGSGRRSRGRGGEQTLLLLYHSTGVSMTFFRRNIFCIFAALFCGGAPSLSYFFFFFHCGRGCERHTMLLIDVDLDGSAAAVAVYIGALVRCCSIRITLPSL